MITIREATLDDVIGIVYVQATVWIQHYPNQRYDITEADIRSIEFKNKIREWQHMIQSPQYGVWVAASREKIIGFSTIHTSHNGNELYALYVLPEYQHRGLGVRLLKRSLTGKENETIKLNVAVYNKTAINFYKQHGFELTNHTGVFPLPSGKFIPTVEMRRYGADSIIPTAYGESSYQPVAPVAAAVTKREPSTVGRTRLAKLSGLRPSTIKYYTEVGLLPYWQEEEGLKRYYDLEEATHRLQEIKKLRDQGYSIVEIKEKLS